jgi:hypothetical protein
VIARPSALPRPNQRRFLVGAKGNGVFGIDYRVHGPSADPKVAVDPLTSVAPTILRKWFVDPSAVSTPDAAAGDASAHRAIGLLAAEQSEQADEAEQADPADVRRAVRLGIRGCRGGIADLRLWAAREHRAGECEDDRGGGERATEGHRSSPLRGDSEVRASSARDDCWTRCV